MLPSSRVQFIQKAQQFFPSNRATRWTTTPCPLQHLCDLRSDRWLGELPPLDLFV
jgi:hypothetical protein